MSEVCTLITGFQGNGKTLYLVDFVEKLRQETGRAVFYSGINGLTLPWTMFGGPGPDPNRPWETDASTWHELPDGSIIVIDEAQRLMRAGGLVKDPPLYLTKMETLRHRGHTLILATQEPMLLNAHARKLCGTHKHIMRQFGLERATVHEFKGVRENVGKSRKDSIRTRFNFPKKMYGCYKSAEVHTIKRTIPWKLVALVVAVPLVVGYASYRVFWLRPSQAEKPPAAGTQVQAAPGTPGAPAGRPHQAPGFDYASFQPRVPGLPWTAPRYDELTQPTRVPVIVGCWLVGEPATKGFCITQQGTKVSPPLETIKSFMWGGGAFRDFDPEQSGGTPVAESRLPSPMATGAPAQR